MSVLPTARVRPALFAFSNEINPIGACNIWRRAKTLEPWKLPYCRVMLRFFFCGTANKLTAQQIVDLSKTPHVWTYRATLPFLSSFLTYCVSDTGSKQWDGSRAVCILVRRTLFRLSAVWPYIPIDVLVVKQSHYGPGTGREGSRVLRLPDFKDNRHMKLVRLLAIRTGCLYRPGNAPGTHVC